MKKFIIGLVVVVIAVTAVVLSKNAEYKEHVNLAQCFPADTWAYSGTQNPQRMELGLNFAEIKEYLTEEVGLSVEVSKKIESAVLSLRGAAFGVGELTLVEPNVRVGLVLTGEFEDGFSDDLAELCEQTLKLTEKTEIEGAVIYSYLLPEEMTAEAEKFKSELRVNMTLPMDGKIYVSIGSLDYLKEMIACAAGTADSLATNESFVGLSAEIGATDVLGYFRMQQYLATIKDVMTFGLADAKAALPIPIDINAIFDAVIANFGFNEFGDMATGYNALTQTSISISVLPESNGLYRQQEYVQPMDFPFVPADMYQVLVMELQDPAKGIADLVEAINQTVKLFVPPALGDPVAMAENMSGFKFDDLASHFKGGVAFWQATPKEGQSTQPMCLRIELNDSAAFETFFNAIPSIAQLPKTKEGAITVIADSAAWAVADECFYFSTDIDLLKKSLNKEGENLFDTKAFKSAYKKFDGKQTSLSYSNYAGLGNLFEQAGYPEELSVFFELYASMLSEMRTLQTSVAADGRIRSESFVEFDISNVGAMVSELIKAAKEMDDDK